MSLRPAHACPYLGISWHSCLTPRKECRPAMYLTPSPFLYLLLTCQRPNSQSFPIACKGKQHVSHVMLVCGDHVTMTSTPHLISSPLSSLPISPSFPNFTSTALTYFPGLKGYLRLGIYALSVYPFTPLIQPLWSLPFPHLLPL